MNEELKALTINTVFAEDMRLNLVQSVIDNTEISVVALTELCEDDDELLENAIKALNAAIMKLELVVEDAKKRKGEVPEA